MIENELKKLFTTIKGSNNDELNYVLMHLMADKNDLFSSMFCLFSLDEIYKFVLLYGGTTIKVPTVDRFKETLNTFIAYYLREIKKEEWVDIKQKFPSIDPVREARRINIIKDRLYKVDTTKIKKLKELIKD
jgi:hypothetical protein